LIKRGLLALAILISPLYSEQFIVTYEATSRNRLLINEKYFVSKSMVTLEPREIKESCMLDKKLNEESMESFLKSSKYEVLECLSRFGIKLKSYEVNNGADISSNTVMSIPPTPIDAEFKDDFVKIVIIKD